MPDITHLGTWQAPIRTFGITDYPGIRHCVESIMRLDRGRMVLVWSHTTNEVLTVCYDEVLWQKPPEMNYDSRATTEGADKEPPPKVIPGQPKQPLDGGGAPAGDGTSPGGDNCS